MKTLLAASLLAAGLARPAHAQNPILPRPFDFACVLHGPPGASGTLWVYETQRGRPMHRPAWGTDLGLLGIDFVGRTQMEELLPDRPRRRQGLAGPARLELQAGMGQLYHHARASGGSQLFGFLWIAPDGRAFPRVELPGAAGGAVDPFVARVALDPAGRTLLVATVPAAGGNLLEVDLTTGAVVDRTPSEPALTFSDAGLWLADDWGLGVAAQGVWRFSRAGDQPASRVPFPVDADPSFYSGQAVMSPARTAAAVTAGGAPGDLHVYVLASSGAARRATKVAGPLSPAGFLPESLHGPYLMVSDDARLAAWRTEGATREAHMAPVLAVPKDSVQVSADAYFLDTLDEVGQMDSSFDPKALTLLVGARSPNGEIENADVFRVTLDPAGTPQFQNVTKSSGDATVPFLSPGTITPEVSHRLPAGAGSLVYDSDGNRLLAITSAGQVQTLHADAKELQVVEPVGDQLFLGLRRESGNKPAEAYRVPLDLGGGLVALPGGGAGIEFLQAASDGLGHVSVVRTDGVLMSLVRVDVANAQLETWAGSGPFEGALGHDRAGSLLFTSGPATSHVTTYVWPIARPPFPLVTPSGPATLVH